MTSYQPPYQPYLMLKLAIRSGGCCTKIVIEDGIEERLVFGGTDPYVVDGLALEGCISLKEVS